MSKSLQQEVNDRGIGDCRLVEGTLIPCGYHGDRAHSRPLRLESAIARDRDDPTVGALRSGEDTRELARCLGDAAWPPAGGWYLVQEQRRWLRDQVLAYARRGGGSRLRILEAGSASHVHHVTYLSVLQQALDSAAGERTLEVITVDRCPMPVLAIEALRAGGGGRVISLPGREVELHPELSRLLRRTGVLGDARITGRLLNRDLTDVSWSDEVGECDLVTEHFISAVLGNFDLLGDFRATYARLLKPGGWLLCACGLAPHTDRGEYDRFIELNSRHGLALREIRGTWDPYGMKREQIEVLLEDRPLRTHLDNTLFRFERVA